MLVVGYKKTMAYVCLMLLVVLLRHWNVGGTTTTGGTASSLLRKQRQQQQQQQQSSCNEAPNQDTCFQTIDDATSAQCQWCISGAIASECMSPEQAKELPPAVFDCVGPTEQQQQQQRYFAAAAAGGGSTSDANRSRSSNKNSFVFQRGTETENDYGSVHVTVTEKDHGHSDLCDASSKSLSGYMDIKGSEYDKSGENKHLFYWMFEKRGDTDDKTPFVVWLTGGPGCSSTMALLTENGPCSVNKDGETVTANPYSWTEAAHVLWLDQPAGVGYSYGKETDSNQQMVAEDAYYFFQAFFQAHAEYAANPLFIVGESYAGHYVPAIAHRIWRGNSNNQDEKKNDTIALALSGFSVGNGLTDPERQYPWYPDMAYNNSHGIKVVDESTYEAMKAVVPRCAQLIRQCNRGDSLIDTFACQTAFLVCNAGLTSPYQMTGKNPYDVRKMCDVPPLCYDFRHVTEFLNSERTKRALGVDEAHSHKWDACNFAINMKFHVDWMKSFAPYVADLLNADVPALMYAGDVDFVCNYLGNRAWTAALDWKGHDEFAAAGEHDWNDGAGLARTVPGFTFLQVYDAGHMVPSDKPKVALEMLKTFLSGGSF